MEMVDEGVDERHRLTPQTWGICIVSPAAHYKTQTKCLESREPI